MSRLALERELLAQLLAETNHELLRRRLRGLRIVGIDAGTFSAENARLFTAIVALAGRGDFPEDADLERETRGRVTADYVCWLRTAYTTERSLYALALRLLDADRRSLLESVGAVARNAARDPAADVDRTIGILVAHLRRARRAAA